MRANRAVDELDADERGRTLARNLNASCSAMTVKQQGGDDGQEITYHGA
jgi:hypothetical protein